MQRLAPMPKPVTRNSLSGATTWLASAGPNGVGSKKIWPWPKLVALALSARSLYEAGLSVS